MSAVVACAVVRDDPPRVFVAEDLDTLNWVLACQLVATTPGGDLPAGERDALRLALREERWGTRCSRSSRVPAWRWTCTRAPSCTLAAEAEVGPLELQLTPLFTD